MITIKDALALYDSGQYQESFNSATSLANMGNAAANVLLGWIFENGKIGAPNMDLALRNYQIAASADPANGNYALGLFLRKQGQPQNAFECFGNSAKGGSLPGAYNAGLCCDLGIGTDLDKLRALEYYEFAAKGGHVFARAKLARRDVKSGNLLKGVRGIVKFVMSMLHMLIIVSKDKYDERILE